MTRILLCATDAGGARNLAPVAAKAVTLGLEVAVAGSDVTLPLFAEAGVSAFAVTDIAALFDARPTAVICGTARPGAPEPMVLTAAVNRRIHSVSVLDEWYGFRQRFAEGALPDVICCPDEVAVAGAVAEDLPRQRLVATGSPALAATADRIAAMAATPPPPPDVWDGETRATLLFLSETHSIDYGDRPGACGPLGPWLGYCERDVRAHIGQTLAEGAWSVVEKLHPSDRTTPAPPNPGPEAWTSLARTPLWPLLWHAGTVVGMRTMALLEAAMMGHRPLSYQPGLIGHDDCTAVRLGLADSARDVRDLARWLAAGPHVRSAPIRPDCADSLAADRVLALALNR